MKTRTETIQEEKREKVIVLSKKEHDAILELFDSYLYAGKSYKIASLDMKTTDGYGGRMLVRVEKGLNR